jgi:hypothetical protein
MVGTLRSAENSTLVAVAVTVILVGKGAEPTLRFCTDAQSIVE